MHAGKGPYSSCAGKHGSRYKEYVFKPKTSSCFPNFEASNAWQMGHNSQEGFFLGQELLLDLKEKVTPKSVYFLSSPIKSL